MIVLFVYNTQKRSTKNLNHFEISL